MLVDFWGSSEPSPNPTYATGWRGASTAFDSTAASCGPADAGQRAEQSQQRQHRRSAPERSACKSGWFEYGRKGNL